MRLAAISVDLDEIPNYFAIHGLATPKGPGATAVYDVALDRLEAFARAHDLPLTLFTIGRDMQRPESARKLRELGAKGHEIGNHTLDHLYDLTRRSRSEMREQVDRAQVDIEAATGQRPSGFRAPGYTVTDELFAVLDECAIEYDSSVFPCPPYYAAKATAIGAIGALAKLKLRKARSKSVLDTPRVLEAPTRPYRVGRPYWKTGNGMLELPIQVTRGPRLPFIGTSVTVAGPGRARLLTRMVLGEPLVNLELHGIDVLDARDGLDALRPHQLDVRVEHEKKLEALTAVVETLRRDGYSFVRLDEAARAF